jgi:hypothetical protein
MLIDINKAEAGMVLSAPVTDRLGRTLLGSGETLSERHIQKLSSWGIEAIQINAGEETAEGGEAADSAIASEDQEKLAAKLDVIFRGTEEVPLMRDLRELAGEHLLRNPSLWSIFNIKERI